MPHSSSQKQSGIITHNNIFVKKPFREKNNFDILLVMKISTHTLFFCFIFFGKLTLPAQTFSSLPKLTPSYSENFDHYESHPFLCIKDVFFDDNGKMWLNLCPDANFLNLHLIQFDGYSFHLAQGDLKKLNINSRFQAMLNKRTLIGFSNIQGIGSVFSYDLPNNKVRFHHLPEKGKLRFMTVKENGQVLFMLKVESKWTIYEMKDTLFIKQDLSNMEYWQTTINAETQTTKVQFFDGENLWISPLDFSFLERINLSTGHRKKFGLSTLVLRKKEYKSHPVASAFKITEVKDTIYLSFRLQGRHHQLKAAVEAEQFVYIKGAELGKKLELFSDEKGNTLFVYTYPKQKHQAILEDREGKRFDYSAFFEPLNRVGIQNVSAPDFKQQLIICHSKGILLHILKSSNAIHNFLPQFSIRAITSISEQQYLVATQNTERFIINKKINEAYPLNLPECNFQTGYLVPDKEGNIWAAAGSDGLIKFTPSTNSCQHFPTSGKRIEYFFTFISPTSNCNESNGYIPIYSRFEKWKNPPFSCRWNPFSFPSWISRSIVWAK